MFNNLVLEGGLSPPKMLQNFNKGGASPEPPYNYIPGSNNTCMWITNTCSMPRPGNECEKFQKREIHELEVSE